MSARARWIVGLAIVVAAPLACIIGPKQDDPAYGDSVGGEADAGTGGDGALRDDAELGQDTSVTPMTDAAAPEADGDASDAIDGDAIGGDAIGGDASDAIDGDATDGDATDGDAIDGDATEGDAVEGEVGDAADDGAVADDALGD